MSRKTKFVAASCILTFVAVCVTLYLTFHVGVKCYSAGASPNESAISAIGAAIMGVIASGTLTTYLAFFAKFLPDGAKHVAVGLIDVTRIATYKTQFDGTKNPAEQLAIIASVDVAIADLKAQLFPAPNAGAKT